MRFSLLLLTGMVAVTTALPQRPGGGRGRFRGGQRFGQEGQDGAGLQGANLLGSENAQGGIQPPAVVPDNAQAGVGQDTADEGNLNNPSNLPPNDQGSPDNGNQVDQGVNNQGTPSNEEAGNANQNGSNVGVGGQDQNSQQTGPDNQGQNNQDQNDQDQNNQDNQNQTGQPQPNQSQNSPFDPSLVPDFGVQPGISPDGQGNCLGLNDVKIPCSCPPDRQDFIQRVQSAVAAGNSEGVPVEFPLDDSSASKRARIQTSIVVLQNLNGRGVGCPAAATTFLAQKDDA